MGPISAPVEGICQLPPSSPRRTDVSRTRDLLSAGSRTPRVGFRPIVSAHALRCAAPPRYGCRDMSVTRLCEGSGKSLPPTSRSDRRHHGPACRTLARQRGEREREEREERAARDGLAPAIRDGLEVANRGAPGGPDRGADGAPRRVVARGGVAARTQVSATVGDADAGAASEPAVDIAERERKVQRWLALVPDPPTSS